jgi:hypothetical protein
VIGHPLCLVERRQVLAEMRVERPDPGRLERQGCGKGILEGLTGHEPPDGTLHERQARQPALEPLVASEPQQDGAHHGNPRTMPPSTGTMAPVT